MHPRRQRAHAAQARRRQAAVVHAPVQPDEQDGAARRLRRVGLPAVEEAPAVVGERARHVQALVGQRTQPGDLRLDGPHVVAFGRIDAQRHVARDRPAAGRRDAMDVAIDTRHRPHAFGHDAARSQQRGHRVLRRGWVHVRRARARCRPRWRASRTPASTPRRGCGAPSRRRCSRLPAGRSSGLRRSARGLAGSSGRTSGS